jgi:hypothetical protein
VAVSSSVWLYIAGGCHVACLPEVEHHKSVTRQSVMVSSCFPCLVSGGRYSNWVVSSRQNPAPAALHFARPTSITTRAHCVKSSVCSTPQSHIGAIYDQVNISTKRSNDSTSSRAIQGQTLGWSGASATWDHFGIQEALEAINVLGQQSSRLRNRTSLSQQPCTCTLGASQTNSPIYLGEHKHLWPGPQQVDSAAGKLEAWHSMHDHG